jgi:signal-transduction protein with cAMP-binding, CBS, and nucleotidyltransferase domain
MLCPTCRTDNFEGDDHCANCGADLAAADKPQALADYHDTVLGQHLDRLGVGAPALVPATTEVGDAIRDMHATGRDCLLITEGDQLVGIFTDRDAVVKVAGRDVDNKPVSAFMTPDPVVLRSSDSLAVAIHKMAVGGFRHIPVVQDGRPIGVVSAADLFHQLVDSLG